MTQSRSDQNQQSRRLPPLVSNAMYKGVSQYRRETLAQETEAGLFRDGSANSQKNGGLTPASYVVGGINKTANLSGHVGSSAWAGNSNTVRQMPEVYSPLWLNSNLNLPRDRATINAWLRAFYALNPIVQNAINLHATYPISKLNIKCPNKKIERFFNDMIEEIGLMDLCVQAAQEFWLLGETFVYGELDENTAKWSRLVIQNPDYIVVKKSVMANEPLIMLRPDDNLKNIVNSNKPADIDQKNKLNSTIVNHIKRGENIPLDNFYVSHLARRISPYEVRGTGLPVCCFRQLMLFDWLRESKFVQAQSMVNPMTVVKIGGGADNYKATPQDIEHYREVFEQAEFDKNFKIFTHDGVSIERVGYNSGILDVSGDITQLIKEMYIGLMVPSVVMDGGGDITYANGGVSLDILRQRYMQFRNMMSAWLKNKIFAPISKLNDFYNYDGGEKKLIIPEIDWNHMSLFDTSDYVNVLVQLSSGEKQQVSKHTLYRSLSLDFDEENAFMRKEAIVDAIHKKELASLDRMPLNELRSLNEDDDIPEIVEPVNQEQSPYSDAGQTPPAGGDMALPGMSSAPPMGGSMPPSPPSGGGPAPSAPPAA